LELFRHAESIRVYIKDSNACIETGLLNSFFQTQRIGVI
jgi:hypothetical protein